MTTFSDSSVPGTRRVVAPVAMMTLSAVTVRDLPSSSSTSMVLASEKVPQPWISSILFFFIRKWTPLTMESETSRLRAKAGL